MNPTRTISGRECPQPTPGESSAPLFRHVIAAIHGILTLQTPCDWPDHFDAWMALRDPRFRVIKKEYSAGPFPRINVWFRNHWLARSLANELLLFAREGFKISMVAHSNGADIALKATRILAAKKFRVETLVLIGGACEADVGKNGLLALQQKGLLGKAVAFSSPEDFATKTFIIWPYGHLGTTGFLFDGKPISDDDFRTTWFGDCRHSTYFSPLSVRPGKYVTFRTRTFSKALEEIAA